MRTPKKFWFWLWMGWLGIFVVAEGIAIFDKDSGDTLSESIWFLQQAFWPLTVGLGALFAFLIVHFIVDRRSRK